MKEQLRTYAEDYVLDMIDKGKPLFHEETFIAGYQKAMEAQKQPFQVEKGDTEPFQAKLRNALSPIYGLAEMIINSEGSDELIGMCVEQAKIAIQNTERIDRLLIAIEQKQPEMSLEECKQAIADEYEEESYEDLVWSFADMEGADGVNDFINLSMELSELYANQFREEQKWVSVDEAPIPIGKVFEVYVAKPIGFGEVDYFNQVAFYEFGDWHLAGMRVIKNVTHYKELSSPPPVSSPPNKEV